MPLAAPSFAPRARQTQKNVKVSATLVPINLSSYKNRIDAFAMELILMGSALRVLQASISPRTKMFANLAAARPQTATPAT